MLTGSSLCWLLWLASFNEHCVVKVKTFIFSSPFTWANLPACPFPPCKPRGSSESETFLLWNLLLPLHESSFSLRKHAVQALSLVFCLSIYHLAAVLCPVAICSGCQVSTVATVVTPQTAFCLCLCLVENKSCLIHLKMVSKVFSWVACFYFLCLAVSSICSSITSFWWSSILSNHHSHPLTLILEQNRANWIWCAAAVPRWPWAHTLSTGHWSEPHASRRPADSAETWGLGPASGRPGLFSSYCAPCSQDGARTGQSTTLAPRAGPLHQPWGVWGWSHCLGTERRLRGGRGCEEEPDRPDRRGTAPSL